MATTIHTAVLSGIEAVPVDVHVTLTGGIPAIVLVGAPDSVAPELRNRVRCAMKSSGFEVPRLAVTVELSPADLCRTGAGLDLAVATAILAATNQVPTRGLDGLLMVGELGIRGEVAQARGTVAYLNLARELGLECAGGLDLAEARALGAECAPMARLSQLARGAEALVGEAAAAVLGPPAPTPDFADVPGQARAKRACAIAADALALSGDGAGGPRR